MSKRSYQQYCPLAQVLDLVGERWTLLILRELELGPRRFSDLQRGLPGVNPNLLSQRLQDLEARDIITRQPLPPPARGQAYALTPNGEGLSGAMMPMAQWGMQFLRVPIPDDEFLGAITAVAALRHIYRPELAPDESLAAEIHLEPDIFRLHLTATQIDIEQGFLPDAPLGLHTDPKPLLGLAGGFLSVEAAQQADLLQIERGSVQLAQRFFAQFTLPRSSE